MERYELKQLYASVSDFKSALEQGVTSMGLMMASQYSNSVYSTFIAYAIYKYFCDDYVHYTGDTSSDVATTLMYRMAYDVSVKFPYWKVKYDYILKLFTEDEISLLQSSKMTSSSSEKVNSAGGVIQKSASTPTGVSSATADEMEISNEVDEYDTLNASVLSSSFADKYTNYQGKTSTGNKTSGERSGVVLREGSIDELLKILEKLPSSFADEITKEVSKHFDLVYSY